jgi:hypothetical protein
MKAQLFYRVMFAVALGMIMAGFGPLIGSAYVWGNAAEAMRSPENTLAVFTTASAILAACWSAGGFLMGMAAYWIITSQE